MEFAGKGYPMPATPGQACPCSEGLRFRVSCSMACWAQAEGRAGWRAA